MGRQFLTATEDEIRQMICCLDTYPYSDSQVFMYLTWVLSGTDATPQLALENMKGIGRRNARNDRT